MIYQSPKNPNSHLTVKERETPSLPTRVLLERGLIKGRVLDFGCGLGLDVKFLKSKGFDVTSYDPYYYPDYPTGEFDTIICHYVLNVLLPIEQSHVLMAVSELLALGGKAYFSVRRDISKNDFRYNPRRECKVYQCNVKLGYQSIFRTKNCEMYEYQHYPLMVKGDSDCVFCNLDASRKPITESATFYAIFDKYPVSEGHTLIIPKRHISDYFGLSTREKQASLLVLDRVKAILQKRFSPDGFNVGINVGAAAGQTVHHVHTHLIPRYHGDMENPRGGIRHCVAGKGDYG